MKTAREINNLIKENGELLVTCGSCGGIILTTSPQPDEETCPYCHTEGEAHEYPDLFY